MAELPPSPHPVATAPAQARGAGGLRQASRPEQPSESAASRAGRQRARDRATVAHRGGPVHRGWRPDPPCAAHSIRLRCARQLGDPLSRVPSSGIGSFFCPMNQAPARDQGRRRPGARSREPRRPVLSAHGVVLVDLEWQTDRGGWVLRVTIEREAAPRTTGGGVTLEDCADGVARRLHRARRRETSSPALPASRSARPGSIARCAPRPTSSGSPGRRRKVKLGRPGARRPAPAPRHPRGGARGARWRWWSTASASRSRSPTWPRPTSSSS